MTTLVIARQAGCLHALEAWMRADKSSDYVRTYDDKLTGIDRVVVGTSCLPLEEQDLLVLAKSKGIPTVAYVDGPYSVPVRFPKAYPDIIWVSDKITMQACINELPVNCYMQIMPPYLKREMTKGHQLKILFLSQPIKEAMAEVNKDYGYDEYQAFNNMLTYLKDVETDKVLKIRYHPREVKAYDCNKYAKLVQSVNYRMGVGQSVDVNNSDLAQDILWADWVVGMDTPAMHLAVALGKRVLCAIPHGLKMKSEDREIQYIYDIRE